MSIESRVIPRVVACMPAWNAATFIGPVLESLASQTYGNLAVLISVDASDDQTADVCTRFAAHHANFVVLRQSVRLGWIANSNVLLRMANGEYVFFAGHDDPLEPTYVSRLVQAMAENPNAVLAFSDMLSDRGIERYCDLEGIADRFARAKRLLSPSGPWWCAYRGLVRASVVKEHDGLRRHAGGEFGADWPWLMRLALRGEFVRVPVPLLRKNRRPDGLNAKLIRSSTPWKRLCVRLACLREIRRARPPLSTSMRLHVTTLLDCARAEWWLVQRKWLAHPRFRNEPD